MSNTDPKGKKPSKPYSEKDQWEDDLDLPPLEHKKLTVKKPILEKAEFDKKRKKPLKLLFSILFILLTTGLLFTFYQSNEENTTALADKSEKQQNEMEPIIDQLTTNIEEQKKAKDSNESWSEDTVIVEELSSDDLLVEEISEYKGPQNYHIIVGSFKNENNARSWLEKTSFEGYGVQSIREYEGWYRIIFLSYASVEQAEIEIDSIRNNLNLKAWIAYMN